MHTDDRLLVLSPIDGTKPLNSSGIVDNRLFKGGNRLHAIRDPMTSIWRMEYDSGVLPGALQKKFTSMNKLMTYVTNYFAKRNIKIDRVDG